MAIFQNFPGGGGAKLPSGVPPIAIVQGYYLSGQNKYYLQFNVESATTDIYVVPGAQTSQGNITTINNCFKNLKITMLKTVGSLKKNVTYYFKIEATESTVGTQTRRTIKTYMVGGGEEILMKTETNAVTTPPTPRVTIANN